MKALSLSGKFTVVVPLYNKELSIKNTIQSVLAQTFQNFEIVVVDDGSTDNSAGIVKAIADERIRLIHQQNQGVSAARNRGIQEARHDWVAFLDGDDLWSAEHLQEVTRMMHKFPEEKVFVTSFEYSDKRPLFKHSRSESTFKIGSYFKEAMRESLMWTSIVVVHKSCIEKVGGFNERLNRGEDLDLWGRLARDYQIVKSQKVTAIYRIETENRSSSSFDTRKSRVFNYQFERSTSADETAYYKQQITRALRGYLLSKRVSLFAKLYLKHRKNISLLSVLKVRPI